MCCKFLFYVANLNIFYFIKKINPYYRGIYVFFSMFLTILAIKYFSYIYHSNGIEKLMFFLIIIVFLFGAILHGLRMIIEYQGDLQKEYTCISACVQLLGIVIGLIYFIFKFLILLFILIVGLF